VLEEARAYEFSLPLTKNILARRNILIIELPDAVSPAQLKLNEDQRVLGLNIELIELQSQDDAQER
jgi:hypothetical protein